MGLKVMYNGNTLQFHKHDNLTALDSITSEQIANWNNVFNKIGQVNGIAQLDGTGKVPSTQLPSYVDDVQNISSVDHIYTSKADLPTPSASINGYNYLCINSTQTDSTSLLLADTSTWNTGFIVNCEQQQDNTYKWVYFDKLTSHKIYIVLSGAYANRTFRYTMANSMHLIEISESLAIGESSSTAYAGNKGKANADAIAGIKDGTNINSFSAVETALAGKVAIVNTPGVYKLYGIHNGSQYMYTVDENATANTIAIRNANGALKIGVPTDNAHATTKLYVDTLLNEKAYVAVSNTFTAVQTFENTTFDTLKVKRNTSNAVPTILFQNGDKSLGNYGVNTNGTPYFYNAVSGVEKTLAYTSDIIIYALATTTADGLMSSSDKTKLNNIQSGAEVNVQSDWNQTSENADDFIKNKPTIPNKISQLTNDSGYLTQHQDISGKLDKHTVAGSYILYGTSNGSQATYNISKTSAQLYANYIVQRDTNGHINVPLTPTANNHAASKKYIDDSLPTRTKLYITDWS